jgi:hypothetical protein
MSAQPPLAGAEHVDFRGRRFILGRTADRYALWDGATGGVPVEEFALSIEGWGDAWQRYLLLEAAGEQAAPAGGAPYPLTVGQILGGAFRLWGRHFWGLTAMSAVLVIPTQAIVLALTLTTVRIVVPPVAMAEATVPWWVSLITNVLSAVSYALVAGAVIRAGALALQGRRPSIGDSYRVVGRRALTLIVVAVVGGLAAAIPILPGAVLFGTWEGTRPSGLAVGGAVLFLVGLVPALFIAMRFLLGSAVVVIEGRRGLTPLGRSWSLVRGLTWRTLGAMVLAGLILFGVFLLLFAVVFAVFATSANVVTEAVLTRLILWSGISAAVIFALMLPLVDLVIGLLYVDARVRKEGLDLATLARETGA